LLYTDEAIAELIGMAARRGLPSAIHTIGDGAMEQALCQLERAGRGLRHAVVHAQITGADQIVRLGRNRLQVLAQPIFLRADTPIAAARAGDAVRTSYRFKSMLMSGARVAFGSDSPVEPFDVMPNVYCAVTRKGSAAAAVLHPEEAFTMEEALFAYTAAGAYASGEEHVKGRIKPGMYADYVIWDRSLDDVLPEDIPSVRADITVIAGETIYLR